MKLGRYLNKLCLPLLLLISTPLSAEESPAILNPGVFSGSVSLSGYDIDKVIVKAIDINKNLSGSVTVSVPEGVESINYELTLEGDNQYFLMAEVYIAADNYVTALIPPKSSLDLPVGSNIPADISMSPVLITGNISTGINENVEIGYRFGAWLEVPEFETEPWPHQSQNVASKSIVNGSDGINYRLLVAPETIYYNVRAQISVNGFNYNINDKDVLTPVLGDEAVRDYLIDYNSASISGRSDILGVEMIKSEVFGQAVAPLPLGTRSSTAVINDTNFSLPVDEGDWALTSIFTFFLPDSELNDLKGLIFASWPDAIPVADGESINKDFVIDPAFMPGKITLQGANTQLSQGRIRASGYPGGLSHSDISPTTGEFLYVLPMGEWQIDNRLSVWFDYDNDPDSSLHSLIWQQYRNFDQLVTVSGGETFDKLEIEFNTSTVKQYFSVADERELSHPYLKVTRLNSIQSIAQGYGSSEPTILGQAMVTLLEPGSYLVEAFAKVSGSDVEFGSTEIIVEGGESVVIGGNNKPIVKLTNIVDGQSTCEAFIEVTGTATDLQGIESIMINGESIPFESTNNLADPNEVSFNYNVALESGADNTIEIVVNDVDQSGGTTVELSVNQDNCQTDNKLVIIDIKPGSCKNPFNTKSKGVLPVTLFGSDVLDVSLIDIDSLALNGVFPIKHAVEDLGQPATDSSSLNKKDDCQNKDSDGYDDLTLKFKTQHLVSALEASGIELSDGAEITLTISGNVLGAENTIPLQGSDHISIIKK